MKFKNVISAFMSVIMFTMCTYAEGLRDFSESISAENEVYVELYNSLELKQINAFSTRSSYWLKAGEVYYFKIYSQSGVGEYLFNVQYGINQLSDSFNIYSFDEEVNIYKKSIIEMCEALYEQDAEVSKKMYNEYEQILSKDVKIHELPDFLMEYPKEMSGIDLLINKYYGIKYSKLMALKKQYIQLIDKYTGVLNSVVGVSKVSIALTDGVDYYIKIRHANGGNVHADLNITKNIPVVELQNWGYEDIITSNGEYAMYSFTPENSMTYIFEVDNYNGESSAYDTYIKLYGNESMTQRVGIGL